jgi:hypothetical protein
MNTDEPTTTDDGITVTPEHLDGTVYTAEFMAGDGNIYEIGRFSRTPSGAIGLARRMRERINARIALQYQREQQERQS